MPSCTTSTAATPPNSAPGKAPATSSAPPNAPRKTAALHANRPRHNTRRGCLPSPSHFFPYSSPSGEPAATRPAPSLSSPTQTIHPAQAPPSSIHHPCSVIISHSCATSKEGSAATQITFLLGKQLCGGYKPVPSPAYPTNSVISHYAPPKSHCFWLL